jgi:hypothetical protein
LSYNFVILGYFFTSKFKETLHHAFINVFQEFSTFRSENTTPNDKIMAEYCMMPFIETLDLEKLF